MTSETPNGIHPAAIVESGAQIGAGASIGAFSVVGPEVRIGAGAQIGSHVHLRGRTSVGPRVRIFPFASVGEIPQDLKFGGEKTQLRIGARNRIREHVTMNTGTAGGGAASGAASGASGPAGAGGAADGAGSFQRQHWITIGVIGTLLVGVILFDVNVGLGAYACAIVLALLKAGDESEAVKIMPWRVIMMVCGVTVLISVLDETGGLELFTRVLAGVSTANTVTAVMAFTTGFISIYSSTSGVVLPAFLPTVPGLAAQVGGVEPLAIASSMNVGAHLVDVSALSTLGALCMASAPKHEDSRKLFNKLMAWGLSMTVVGGFTCWLLFTVLRIGTG